MQLTPDEFTGRRFGSYEALCRMAVGGMAEIFLGFSRSGLQPGVPVILKRVLTETAEDPTAIEQFLEEARVTAQLASPYIARILDLQNANDEIILVIEFIKGINLDELFEAYAAAGEMVPTGFIARILKDASRALTTAHTFTNANGKLTPIMHRDITPRNIMVGFDGVVRILDFGIARVSGTSRRTSAGMVRGTSAYMSPEQAVGQDVDPRSDVFSLGIITHELLTGKRLFRRPNPADEMKAAYQDEIPAIARVGRKIPRSFDALVMKMLDRNLSTRLASAKDATDEIDRWVSDSVWSHSDCAAVLKNRFAARVSGIAAAIRRIPEEVTRGTDPDRPPARRDNPDATILVRPSVARPSGPTPHEAPADKPTHIMSRDPTPTGDVALEPASDRPTMPGVTGPSIQVARPLMPAPPSRLGEPDGPHPENITSAPTPISAPAQPSLPSSSPLGGETRKVVQSKRSRSPWPIALAVLAALGLGAIVGKLSSNARGAVALGKVSIRSDRPAMVRLRDQDLGPTPFSLMLPEGEYEWRLVEGDGRAHKLLGTVSASNPLDVTVALDSLAPVP